MATKNLWMGHESVVRERAEPTLRVVVDEVKVPIQFKEIVCLELDVLDIFPLLQGG